MSATTTLQLALVEVNRLRRSPALWSATAVTVALLAWQDRREPTMPNVTADIIIAATGALLVAATLMVVANLATLRDQRPDVPETLAALPSRVVVRTGAIAVATTGAGLVLAALIIGVHLMIRMTTGPVAGVFDLYELLAAIAGMAAMAALGVMLGRWLPTAIAAPVFLVVLGVFLTERSLNAWFLPLTESVGGDALGAPSQLRLAYLLAVVVLAVGVALLRHQHITLRMGGVIVTLALLVPLALVLSRSVGSAAAAGKDLECTDRNGVTYCHLPGFAAWVPLWAQAVQPVFNALPSNLRNQFPTIRQHHAGVQTSDANPVDGHVDEFWGRGEAQVEYETFLAGRVAADLTGFDDADAGAVCDGRGQARAVVALWLAGHTAAIPGPDERDVWGLTHLGAVAYGEREHRVATALLDDPDTQALIGQHWNTLTDPATTIEQAAPLLGLSPPPPAAERSVAEPCR